MTESLKKSRNHLAGLRAQAVEAYDRHELIDSGDRAWCIGRPDSSIYRTSVFCDHSGGIVVTGDIDACVFAYNHAAPLERLRWIGRTDDLGYYVAQKAGIGLTDSQSKLTHDVDVDIGRVVLIERAAQCIEDGGTKEVADRYREAAAQLEYGEHVELVMYQLWSDLSFDELEGMGTPGQVLSARVVFAWAAVRRLCELLDARGGSGQ